MRLDQAHGENGRLILAYPLRNTCLGRHFTSSPNSSAEKGLTNDLNTCNFPERAVRVPSALPVQKQLGHVAGSSPQLPVRSVDLGPH